nr:MULTISPECIES: LysR family transcriptional regulator [unclassified Bradyrhizobium]
MALTHSSVSRQIQSLEEDIGATVRTPNPLRRTHERRCATPDGGVAVAAVR